MIRLLKKILGKYLDARAQIKARKGIDPRRYWNGEPLAEEDSAYILTYEKESRRAVWLAPGQAQEFRVPLHALQLDLAFATEGPPSISDGVEVSSGKKQVAHLRYLVPNRWHSCRIQAEKGAAHLTIKNTTSFSLAVADPIFVKPHHATDKFPKNIIVIILDSLIPETLGSYRHDMAEFTPHLTKFFEKSLVYTNAFTQSEWTFPSLFSFMNSRYALDHGFSDLRRALPKDPFGGEKNLAQLLQERGFQTFAYSTAKIFQPAFRAHVGFDRFLYDVFPQCHLTHREIIDQSVMQLRANREGKNFLFLHVLDTHEPWSYSSRTEELSLPAFRMTDAMKEYESYLRGSGDTKAEPFFDEEGVSVLTQRRNTRLKEVDASLRVLFDYLEQSGEAEDSAVILTADHGFPYLNRGAPLLTDSRVHVPLLMHVPSEARSAQRIDELVPSNLALGPTLLALAGSKTKLGEGHPMTPFGDERYPHIVSESLYGPLYKASVRTAELVYHLRAPLQDDGIVRIGADATVLLFERKHEVATKDVSKQYPREAAMFREIVERHVRRFFPEKKL